MATGPRYEAQGRASCGQSGLLAGLRAVEETTQDLKVSGLLMGHELARNQSGNEFCIVESVGVMSRLEEGQGVGVPLIRECCAGHRSMLSISPKS